MIFFVVVVIFGFGFGPAVIGRLRRIRAQDVGRERKRPLIHLFILILNHNLKIINFISPLLILINVIIN